MNFHDLQKKNSKEFPRLTKKSSKEFPRLIILKIEWISTTYKKNLLKN